MSEPREGELLRENAVLKKRLLRSEQHRARTEELKDKLQSLLKSISQEIEDSREDVAAQKRELESLYRRLAEEKEGADRIVSDLLPATFADTLKREGVVRPALVDRASILFTDFVGFSKTARETEPSTLLDHLDECFCAFDIISERHGLQKIKTIGDSYMCAGGLFSPDKNHTIQAALAGLEMLDHMRVIQSHRSRRGLFFWDLRLGMHVGPVVVGAIGKRGLFFDLWGDSVNVAARMEQEADVNTLNVSASVQAELEPYFELLARGELRAKNVGSLTMFIVAGLKTEYAEDGSRFLPNHVLRQALRPN